MNQSYKMEAPEAESGPKTQATNEGQVEEYASFPNSFDYGGTGVMSTEEAQALRSQFNGQEFLLSGATAPVGNYTAAKTRKYSDKDLAKLAGVDDDSEKYWKAVMAHHPPRTHADWDKVVKVLQAIRPDTQSTESRIYRTTKNLLEEHIKKGSQLKWEDSTYFPTTIPTVEELEALRIYGDNIDGFGVMPPNILTLLRQAGLFWLLVDPADRIVPKYWERLARELGLGFKSAESANAKNASSGGKASDDDGKRMKRGASNTNRSFRRTPKKSEEELAKEDFQKMRDSSDHKDTIMHERFDDVVKSIDELKSSMSYIIDCIHNIDERLGGAYRP